MEIISLYVSYKHPEPHITIHKGHPFPRQKVKFMDVPMMYRNKKKQKLFEIITFLQWRQRK